MFTLKQVFWVMPFLGNNWLNFRRVFRQTAVGFKCWAITGPPTEQVLITP